MNGLACESGAVVPLSHVWLNLTDETEGFHCPPNTLQLGLDWWSGRDLGVLLPLNTQGVRKEAAEGADKSDC